MKSKQSPYQWAKNRIELLYRNVKELNDTGVTTAKLDVWSIKKLLALDYYVEPFVDIMHSKEFKEWYYIDPFCGSGLLRIKKHLFPGSPLVALFHTDNKPFSKYYLSDENAKYTYELKARIERILKSKNMKVQIENKKFSYMVEELFSGSRPSHWKDIGYLAFLDPYGLDVDWKSMERILRSGPVDIIFTFMTWAIVWNRNNQLAEGSITRYFGDSNWKYLKTQDDFVNHYCNKIHQFGYQNKYMTFTIDITVEGGRRYDLILATQSVGGARVLNYLKDAVSCVTTQTIDDAFSVTVGDKTDLDSYM